MRKVLISAFLLMAFCAPALSFCGPARLICAEYANSDAVVEAKLTSTQHFYPKNEDRQDWHVYTLAATKIYKGTINNEFRIHEENDSGRAGFLWKKGVSYLLFLNRNDDETWRLDGCGNSDSLQKARGTIQAINSLNSRRGGMLQGSVSGVPLGLTNLKIRVESPEGRLFYEGETDRNHRFRIHLPAGRYRIQLLLDGWTFKKDSILSYEDPAHITIENGGCAQVVFGGVPKSKAD